MVIFRARADIVTDRWLESASSEAPPTEPPTYTHPTLGVKVTISASLHCHYIPAHLSLGCLCSPRRQTPPVAPPLSTQIPSYFPSHPTPSKTCPGPPNPKNCCPLKILWQSVYITQYHTVSLCRIHSGSLNPIKYLNLNINIARFPTTGGQAEKAQVSHH